VHIKDERSQFDVPIDRLWKYLRSEEHGMAHRSTRSHRAKPVGESTTELTMEQNVGGDWR
jgi:hypothetical protein